MTKAGLSRPVRVTLPSDEEILITREFDAPRHLVYKAWTTPEFVRRWWTGGRGEMTVAEIDLRVGGRWRYAMLTNGGSTVTFHGEYREIAPGERIVSTEVNDATADMQALTTVTFAERDAGTMLSVLVRHDSRDNRDAHIGFGMEDGLQDALDLLEETAAALSGAAREDGAIPTNAGS